MIFDTHTHYDDEQFDEDREALINRLPEENVSCICNVGASFEGCVASVAFSEKYPHVYAAVGIHPDYAKCVDDKMLSEMDKMLHGEKVVAVGEIGLDYHWDESPRDIQKEVFKKQLRMAKKNHMPVAIHSRDAAADTLEILKEYCDELKREKSEYEDLLENPGVVHCFSYEKEMAEIYRKLGFYIGVGGVSTFKNARKLREVIEVLPLESIVLETDCPYLAPEPFRGKRNNSAYLKYVVDVIAQTKKVTPAEVERVTFENALRLFRL